MAHKIIWSYEATVDLEALAEYIARDSAFYAAAFVEEILAASRSLDELFERGRVVPEFSNPKIREILVKEYRLIYKIEEDRIVTLALIQWQKGFKETLGERRKRELIVDFV